jgi:hypothetical protein
VSGEDLDNPTKPLWRVGQLFPESGVAAFSGAAGCGKTFLTLDLAWKLCFGADWFGRRTTKSDVYYFALEAQLGVIGRLTALTVGSGRQRPDNFHLGTAFELANEQFVERFIEFSEPSPVIVIDTLSQASPGMDDNDPSDMGRIIHGAQTLATRLGALVILVAHTGKDQTRGIRGHSSLIAALDTSIFVQEVRSHREWKIAKVKDAEGGASFGFDLIQHEVGTDSFGEMQTSCTVQPISGSELQRTKSANATQTTALRALERAITATDEDASEGVSEAAWRSQFDQLAGHKNPDSARRVFQRAKETLLSNDEVIEESGRYRIAA